MRTLVGVVVTGALVALTACGAASGTCGPTECAGVCAQAAGSAAGAATAAAPAGGGGKMSAFEASVVNPILDDVREGVRPWDDHSVGICKGTGRDCPEFLGTEVSDLPPGDYMMRAELRVPKAGTWKVRLETECTITKKTSNGETTSTSTYSKEYDVNYISEEQGSRLSPLYKITSPNPSGAQRCDWKLIGLHPDGDKVMSGSWAVPGKE